MLNDKTNNKKKKSQAIDPYLKHMYFDGIYFEFSLSDYSIFYHFLNRFYT